MKLPEQYGCPKTCAKKSSFSLYLFRLNQDMDYKLAFQYMFWSLMTYITSRLFNTFTFIFIQLSCSMAFMPA